MRSGVRNCPVNIWRVNEIGADPDYNTPVNQPVLWRENAFSKIDTRRGREILVDGQITAETYLRFDFDYLDVIGIQVTDWIEYEGESYDIKAVLADKSDKKYVVVDATLRVVPTGRT